ncbi:PaaI family thioesterase [Nocardia amikacinitolerans]|uniref:PaaI family thioesterase n=1 Tax=Nocardia amikacinitolerans TaxID=756689 RepID=UPI0020A477EF|nr:hotdog fold thioesterase [Nocardia amikacinitolerans]
MWQRIGAEDAGALSETMGIEVLEAEPLRAVARMPVEGNTQPYRLLHGGASCVLAETVGSIAAALHAGPNRIALGTELNASHHLSAVGGYITAVATQVHGGRSAASYEVVISDDAGRRVCTARLTCAIRPRSEHAALRQAQ